MVLANRRELFLGSLKRGDRVFSGLHGKLVTFLRWVDDLRAEVMDPATLAVAVVHRNLLD
jgi:hypothetical protein